MKRFVLFGCLGLMLGCTINVNQPKVTSTVDTKADVAVAPATAEPTATSLQRESVVATSPLPTPTPTPTPQDCPSTGILSSGCWVGSTYFPPASPSPVPSGFKRQDDGSLAPNQGGS